MFSRWNMFSCTVFRVCDGFAHALSLMSALLNMLITALHGFVHGEYSKFCICEMPKTLQVGNIDLRKNIKHLFHNPFQSSSRFEQFELYERQESGGMRSTLLLVERFAVISSIHKTSTVPCELWHGSSSISYPCFFAGWKTKWKLYET